MHLMMCFFTRVFTSATNEAVDKLGYYLIWAFKNIPALLHACPHLYLDSFCLLFFGTLYIVRYSHSSKY